MVTRFLGMTDIRFGGGMFLYINERVQCRLLQGHPNFSNLEILEVY